MTKLLILDIDGTVRRCTVEGQPCPNRPGEQELLPGAAGRMREAAEDGWTIAGATNQGGIGLGFMSSADNVRVIDELRRLIRDQAAVDFHIFAVCPHRPDGACCCRKPQPGMLYSAMMLADVRPANTIMVGDRESDRLAAHAAGCAFIWADDWRRDGFEAERGLERC